MMKDCVLLVHCRHSVSAAQISPGQNRCCTIFSVLISQDVKIEGLKVPLYNGSCAQMAPAAFTLTPKIQTESQCPKNQVRQAALKILLSQA